MDLDAYVPEVEESIPLPSSALEAMPDLTSTEEIEMRAKTIKLFSDMSGELIAPSHEQQELASTLAHQMVHDPKIKHDFAKYPNETIAFLAGLVAKTNHALVEDLATLKNYVITNLIKEIETTDDSKLKVQALKTLGEVDGIDAFKKRSEITHIIKPIEEVEKELINVINVLENVEYSVIEEKNVPDNA
jgi:Zn-dependent oligopeptidase